MSVPVSRIDHVALTVADLDASLDFYVTVLGGIAGRDYEIDGVVSIRQVRIGAALINLHRQGHSHAMVAARPMPGSGDLCFGWDGSFKQAVALLHEARVPIEAGPIDTVGSDGGPSKSVYFRDPDGNLLEFLVSSIDEESLA